VDPYSSAWWFDGWSDERWREGRDPPRAGPCVARPEGWLLREGWMKWGRIGVAEVPRAAGTRSVTREEWLAEPV
jgi:hypothetical protein